MLYLLWYFIYEQWLYKVGGLDNIIIDNLVYFSKQLLGVFSYNIFSYEHIIGIDGSHGVYIGSPCNGLNLMALFSGFIIIFKGSWKNKLWYIPIGIICIHFFNIIRVFILILLAKYAPESIDFNHKYTFTIILYAFIFLGWVIWVKKYSSKKE